MVRVYSTACVRTTRNPRRCLNSGRRSPESDVYMYVLLLFAGMTVSYSICFVEPIALQIKARSAYPTTRADTCASRLTSRANILFHKPAARKSTTMGRSRPTTQRHRYWCLICLPFASVLQHGLGATQDLPKAASLRAHIIPVTTAASLRLTLRQGLRMQQRRHYLLLSPVADPCLPCSSKTTYRCFHPS